MQLKHRLQLQLVHVALQLVQPVLGLGHLQALQQVQMPGPLQAPPCIAQKHLGLLAPTLLGCHPQHLHTPW